MKSWITTALCFSMLALSLNAQADNERLGISLMPKYAKGIVVSPEMQNCGWAERLARTMSSKSNGRVVPMDEAALANAALKVDVTAVKLVAPTANSKRRLGLHVEILGNGKLLAKKDVEDRTLTVKSTVCETISYLADNLGGDLAEWLPTMPVCDAACTGLHPKERVALNALVLFDPLVIAQDDPVRSCNWVREGIPELMKDIKPRDEDDDDDSINEDNPQNLQFFITDQDILKYPGRKLVLKIGRMQLSSAPNAGPVWMEMTAELHDGGMLAASAHSRQTTINVSSNPCKTFERLGDNLLSRMEKWLRDPVLGAELK